MATHSSTLAWKIPWTEEPGRLQSMGSQTVGHDLVTSLSFPSHTRLISYRCVFPSHSTHPDVGLDPFIVSSNLLSTALVCIAHYSEDVG